MCALLMNARVFDHKNIITVANRRKPVCDNYHRAILFNIHECFLMSLSVLLSTDEVASSNIKISGCLTIALAIASRCFCPPDSFALSHQ